MGAQAFTNTAQRFEKPADAFAALVQAARYEHGHGAYTGTIAEKSGFTLFDLPAGVTASMVFDWLEALDNHIPDVIPAQHKALADKIGKVSEDKWGPAACIPGEAPQSWIFFGWASS